MACDQQTVTIDHLGAGGDGVVAGDAPLYVPGALPGEQVRVVPIADRTDRLTLLEVVTPSPDRCSPLCPHFGRCGGCAVQHLDRTAYLQWKLDIVRSAFSARGLSPDIAPVIASEAGARRRATFVAKQQPTGDQFGFRAALSHDVVSIDVCPILRPEIVAALPELQALAAAVLDLRPDAEIRVAVTLADNGLDVAFDIGGGTVVLTSSEQRDLTLRAAALSAVRVSLGDEVLALKAKPFVHFSGALVELPPGAFLQAVADAESHMATLVVAAIPKRAKTVADLFCGLGAFSFPLGQRARVTAVDNDGAHMRALETAARRAKGIKPMTALARDLFKMPMSRTELNAFDAVVFDPPRAGAKAQTEALAKSNVPTVVAVSCNPATLARDARTLIDGGYHLKTVTPIDQFVFSSHVECVAVFTRR